MQSMMFQPTTWLEWDTTSTYQQIIQPEHRWLDTQGYSKLGVQLEIMGISSTCELILETCDILDGEWITVTSWGGPIDAEYVSQWSYINRNVPRDETARLRRYVRWRWTSLSASDQHIAFRMRVALRP